MTSRTATPADQRAYRAASVVRIERRLAILEAQCRKKVCAEQPSFNNLFSTQPFVFETTRPEETHRPKPARVLARNNARRNLTTRIGAVSGLSTHSVLNKSTKTATS